MGIKISNKIIGEKFPTFVIAEAGINHNGSVKIAKQLIRKAKSSGVDAIKFQTFKATDLVSTSSVFFKILKKLELSENDFKDISDYAKSNKLIFLSTPFSYDAVDLLTKLKVPAFKIASGDLTHIPLIKYAASKKKPMIISTGMSTINEIQDAIQAIQSKKNKKIIILHSVSSYPVPPSEVNLNAIITLKKKFHFPIGFSDNGSNMLVPLIAVSMGIKVIEKHFTLSRKMKGPDHSLSADPQQLASLVKNIRSIEKMLGDGKKICQPSELENRVYARRSITANVTMPKGTKINEKMIGIKRPATGIEPKYFSQILGKKTTRKIKIEESLKWKDIR